MAKTNTGADLQTALRASADPAARETIEYLPFDLIDPDPDNFYSLDGLEKLADSIATVGLIDPIRVRPDGERYTVTSGHRRRAAIKLLIDGGDEGWKDAVPCIVDRGQDTPEWAALKLIFANSATRQRSSAEMSREAERVEELLVALREKGYSFPGRMQDHVAEAMNTKASKLKRLHAIRNNLCEDWLALFDRGELNESIAYTLSQQPYTVQQPTYIAIMRKGGLGKVWFTADSVTQIAKNRTDLMEMKCEISGRQCDCWAMRFEEGLARKFKNGAGVYGGCQWGRCCRSCSQLQSCDSACLRALDEKKRSDEAWKAEVAEAEAMKEKSPEEQIAAAIAAAREAAKTNPQTGLLFDRCDRIRKAAAASGADLMKIFADRALDTSELVETMATVEGGADDDNGYIDWYFDNVDELTELADDLNCSVDYLLGCSEAVKAPAPEWQKGNKPDEAGWFAVWSTWDPKWPPEHGVYYFDGARWKGIGTGEKIHAWYPIPGKLEDDEEVEK